MSNTTEGNKIASRTYRVYEGEITYIARKATGIVLKDGSFLQTYPTKQSFYSLTAWWNHWSSVLTEALFEGEEENAFMSCEERWHDMRGSDAPLPSWLLKRQTQLEEYYRIIQQRPTAEPPSLVTTVVATPETTPVVQNRHVTAYEAKAMFTDKTGSVSYNHICLSLESASECLVKAYRAYVLLTGEENPRFSENTLAPDCIRAFLMGDTMKRGIIAHFDGLNLSVKEIRVWA